MEKISDNDSIEAVFVEASGISDPGAIAASFLAFEDDKPDTNVYLSNIVTVVDSDRIYREFMTPIAYWVAALDEKTQKECLEGDEELRESWDSEYGDRINQIVFIGKNYDKTKILSRLEKCLA